MRPSSHAVRRFELEARLVDGTRWEFEYRDGERGLTATVVRADGAGAETKHRGQAAVDLAAMVVGQVAPLPGMSREQLLARSRDALHLSPAVVRHLEVEVEFDDGSEIEAETVD